MKLSFRMSEEIGVRTESSTAEERPYIGPVHGFFAPGNPGRPKGVLDKRTIAGRKAAQALAAEAWEVVHSLLADDDHRLRFEAARIVLEYAHGKPRQAVTIEDLRESANELSAQYGVNSEEAIALASQIVAKDAAPS